MATKAQKLTVLFPNLPRELETELLRHITGQAKDDLTENLFEFLFEHYLHEMPYGTAKARDGDPYQWLTDKLGTIKL